MNMPNLIHLHLLLNHIPIIGMFIAAGLLVAGLIAKNDHLTHATLSLMCVLALMQVPTYITGHLAQALIQDTPGVSTPLISAHQGAAFLAFVSLGVTGGVAWAGMWQFRRGGRPRPWILPAVLACSLATTGLMAAAGNTGGAIRHDELYGGEPQTSVVGDIGARLSAAVQYGVTGTSRYVWPVLETLHFLGLILLLGSVGMLNLRLLGFFRQVPTAPFHRLIPWGVAGLGINVVTGMLFFIGMPFFYVYNLDFHLKIGALVIAGFTLLLYSTRATDEGEELGAGQQASGPAKFVAAVSLLSWIAVVVAGRYMPMFEDTLGF